MMKAIPGFPRYFATEEGQIWSSIGKGKFLKGAPDRKGYLKVHLTTEEKTKKMYIHRCVALAFFENPENYPTVDHINQNPTDNRSCNLRWASYNTQTENRGVFKTNTSGHKNISWNEHDQAWRFQRYVVINGKRKVTYFRGPSKNNCIWFKFAWFLLRHKTV
jgi:hypothetical protein